MSSTWWLHPLGPLVTYVVLAALIVFAWRFIILPVWRASGAGTRISMLVTVYLGICAVPVFVGTGRDKWEMLTGIATALAAIVTLFYGQLQKAAHAARISVRVERVEPGETVCSWKHPKCR